jgi:hypothetical protein
MDFDKIIKELTQAGVEVTQKGFFKKGTKRKADDAAEAILKLNKVVGDEFLAEYNKRVKEKLAKLAAESNDSVPGSMTQDYMWITLQHEILADVDAVGEPDRKLFNKIKYALNPFDGSIILLINMHDSNWKAVPLSGGAADRIQLVTLCSQAKPNHPELFTNYYDEIVAYTTRPLRKIFAQFRNKEIKDKVALAANILKYIPHTLLQNCCVKALCQKKKVSITEDKEEILFLFNVSGEKKTFPVSGIVQTYGGDFSTDGDCYCLENNEMGYIVRKHTDLEMT